MSRFESMTAADVLYTYDGTFPGFLCCVFESVYAREIPAMIAPEGDAPLTMMDTKYIETDLRKCERVRASIPAKISKRAEQMVYTVFLSCLEDREIKLLRFLLKAYDEGGRIMRSLGDPILSPLLKAEKHLLGEAHLLTGFVRFADVGGVLVSTITPKNYILPFLMRHFTLRFDNEDFMIYDKTHKAALVYQNRRAEIIQVDSLKIPDFSVEELKYQSLWKQFYNTIAIKERENPRCRMTHMPKRYWENMLEVRDLLDS